LGMGGTVGQPAPPGQCFRTGRRLGGQGEVDYP
jgi:hypothetical protein